MEQKSSIFGFANKSIPIVIIFSPVRFYGVVFQRFFLNWGKLIIYLKRNIIFLKLEYLMTKKQVDPSYKENWIKYSFPKYSF